MAVSPLILVRFEKFKIWNTPENSPVLLDLPSLARARGRHYSNNHFLLCGCQARCYGPISLTVRWISLIVRMQFGMTDHTLHAENQHPGPNSQAMREFPYFHGNH